MIRIVLACAGGFSTSMLMAAMEKAAKLQRIEMDIEAIAEADIENHMGFDILLLAPQIAHREEELKEELDVPVCLIDSYDYGTMNGMNVLNQALATLK